MAPKNSDADAPSAAASLHAGGGGGKSSPLASASPRKVAQQVRKDADERYVPTTVPYSSVPAVGEAYEGLLGNAFKSRPLLEVRFRELCCVANPPLRRPPRNARRNERERGNGAARLRPLQACLLASVMRSTRP